MRWGPAVALAGGVPAAAVSAAGPVGSALGLARPEAPSSDRKPKAEVVRRTAARRLVAVPGTEVVRRTGRVVQAPDPAPLRHLSWGSRSSAGAAPVRRGGS